MSAHLVATTDRRCRDCGCEWSSTGWAQACWCCGGADVEAVARLRVPNTESWREP